MSQVGAYLKSLDGGDHIVLVAVSPGEGTRASVVLRIDRCADESEAGKLASMLAADVKAEIEAFSPGLTFPAGAAWDGAIQAPDGRWSAGMMIGLNERDAALRLAQGLSIFVAENIGRPEDLLRLRLMQAGGQIEGAGH